MRGESMKDKSKKSTYSTIFGVDPTFSLFRWNLLIIIEISLVAVWLHFRRKSGFSAVRLSITYVSKIARKAR